jgi:hypothetical protein
VSSVIYLVANAIRLLVANALLDDMSVNGSAFVIAVLILTGVEVLVQPLITQIAIENANALVTQDRAAPGRRLRRPTSARATDLHHVHLPRSIWAAHP